MRNILVLRGGALGDLIVTLPALELLRRRWPEARIEMVGNAVAADIAVQRGLITAAHSQHDRRWSALFNEVPLPPELCSWLSAFDLVVSYWPDHDGQLQRRFPIHHGQIFLSAAAMPSCAPAAAHYCAPLRQLGLEPRELWFRISPTVVERNGPITIHPGSGSLRKNWRAENWLTLAAQLPAPVSIILGDAETETRRDIAVTTADMFESSAAKNIGVQLLRQRPLAELIDHLAQCRLFLGHDSGISHLAAGCGSPCVLLFGPTDPRIWAPPAPNVRVLRRADDLNAMAVADVREAALAALADRR
jgi:heptosyltransferase III